MTEQPLKKKKHLDENTDLYNLGKYTLLSFDDVNEIRVEKSESKIKAR